MKTNDRSLLLARRLTLAVSVLTLLVPILACGGGGGTVTPPPPQTATPPTPQTTQITATGGGTTGTTTTTTTGTPPVVPEGQVLVTVSASSSPVGATVTGGGTLLGTTPFTTQVPVPIAQPGETQTFQFTFQIPGYQPATITASPVNNTITLHTALQPMGTTTVGAVDPRTGATTGAGAGAVAAGGDLRVPGRGGGPIRDFQVTTGTATVAQPCMIDQLSVDLQGSHTFNRDLVVTLRGPDGTSYPLQSHSSRSPFRRHGVRRARGHNAQGPWVLTVADTVGADSGVLRDWSMDIRCR